jgi:hypothetical protein
MRTSTIYLAVAAVTLLLGVTDIFPDNVGGFFRAIAGSSLCLFLITRIFGGEFKHYEIEQAEGGAGH